MKSISDWEKIDFDKFAEEYGIDLLIKNAPTILYPKKDKEHEALNSLIAFLFLAGGICAYIALSLFLMPIWFSLPLFIIIIVTGTLISVILIVNYLKSNVYIRPYECWVEIFKGKSNPEYFSFLYYPVFTGKCHPNKAINVIYKMYQKEILKSTIDISEIQVFLKLDQMNNPEFKQIGVFFQYGEGKNFKNENIEMNVWKYFPYETLLNENYISVANWNHQYEWRNDLNLDFDKLHNYAPWVVKKWGAMNLKPLTEEYKDKVMWRLREIEDIPKLKPWNNEFEKEGYRNNNSNKDLERIEKAIEKIIGEEYYIKNLRDIKEYLFKFQAYFRELKL